MDEVRAKLFNYRLANYEEVQSSQFDVPDFTGSTRQNARGLGACLVNAPDLRNRLIALLRGQDESVRAEQSAEMSPVLESLLVVCHERRKNVHVGEIAKLASEILEVRGERIGLSPKEVGSKLKLLGLRTCRLDAGGRGLKLSPEICGAFTKRQKHLECRQSRMVWRAVLIAGQFSKTSFNSIHCARHAHDARVLRERGMR